MNSFTKVALALFFMLIGTSFAYSQQVNCNDACADQVPWQSAGSRLWVSIPGTACRISVQVMMRDGECNGTPIHEFQFLSFEVEPGNCNATDEQIFEAIHSQLVVQARAKFNLGEGPITITIKSPACWEKHPQTTFISYTHCNVDNSPCCITIYEINAIKNNNVNVQRVTKIEPPNQDCNLGGFSTCYYMCGYSAPLSTEILNLTNYYPYQTWNRVALFENNTTTELSGNVLVSKDNDNYTFSYEGDITGDLSLMIYDINGKIVKEGKFTKNGDHSEFILNDFNALNGVYFYRVVNVNSSLAEGKIIIY